MGMNAGLKNGILRLIKRYKHCQILYHTTKRHINKSAIIFTSCLAYQFLL